jgi:RecA-family ATPase
LSKDEIRGLFTYFARIREKFGIYIILIHHDRKATEGNKRPRDLSDVYGSQYITAEPESVLHLWRPSPESRDIELRTLKGRLAPPVDRTVITRAKYLQFVMSENQPQKEKEVKFDGLSRGNDGGPPDTLTPF